MSPQYCRVPVLAIIADNSFYVLCFHHDAYDQKVEEGAEITNKGVEEAFNVLAEIMERSGVPTYD